MKRGPKVSALLGPLKPHTVLLDEKTVRMLEPLGENKSDAIRRAVRTAYGVYQRSNDPPVSQQGTATSPVGAAPAPSA